MVSSVTVPVDGRAPSGPTHVYLAGDGDLLVDPANRTAELDTAVADALPAHVAVTHHHDDHVGALADYATEFDLTVWARAGRERDFANSTGVEPDRTFTEGTVIPAGDGVTVRDTPGHAPEHVAFDPAGDGSLLTGDLAVAEGSVVVGAPAGDMRSYVASLRRVHASAPDRLYPGHGPTIEEPRATCERLIRHRLDREKRVRNAVLSGARDPDAIVDEAYNKDVSAVRDLARATVVAHLEKLDFEGALSWDGRRASI